MTLSPLSRRGAFTLLEVLLAVSLLAVASTITFLAFHIVTTAWKSGLTLTDNLHHGDFVMEQVEMALRSAYYPDSTNADGYGFWMEDNGTPDEAADVISWVKLGGALVGRDTALADSPHRVEVWLDKGEEEHAAVYVKAWRQYAQAEDFDPENIPPEILSRRVTGLNCRVAERKPGDDEEEEEIEWLDEWEDTNRIPDMVELTLLLDPITPGGDPIEIRRIVSIPVAPLSWARRIKHIRDTERKP